MFVASAPSHRVVFCLLCGLIRIKTQVLNCNEFIKSINRYNAKFLRLLRCNLLAGYVLTDCSDVKTICDITLLYMSQRDTKWSSGLSGELHHNRESASASLVCFKRLATCALKSRHTPGSLNFYST